MTHMTYVDTLMRHLCCSNCRLMVLYSVLISVVNICKYILNERQTTHLEKEKRSLEKDC